MRPCGAACYRRSGRFPSPGKVERYEKSTTPDKLLTVLGFFVVVVFFFMRT